MGRQGSRYSNTIPAATITDKQAENVCVLHFEAFQLNLSNTWKMKGKKGEKSTHTHTHTLICQRVTTKQSLSYETEHGETIS